MRAAQEQRGGGRSGSGERCGGVWGGMEVADPLAGTLKHANLMGQAVLGCF